MSKIIQYLTQNPSLISLFLKEEICFVGLQDDLERKALVDVLTSESRYGHTLWK